MTIASRALATIYNEPMVIDMGTLSQYVSMLTEEAKAPINDVQDGVKYVKQYGVASIFIDGVMNKKAEKGLCISIAGYDEIIAHIEDADNDDTIDDIVLVVDTPGGTVAGVENVAVAVENAKKPITVVVDNMMCSGGMWAFAGADRIYATNTSVLGSIGVIVSYTTEEDGKKQYHLVSKNAPNKRCDLADSSCIDRVQEQIDTLEDKFYERMVKAFGKTREEIKADFKDGAVEYADVLLEKGYIDGIATYQEVYRSLATKTDTLATMPPQRKIVNSTTESKMALDEKAIEDLQKTVAQLQARQDELQAENEQLTAQAEAQSFIFGMASQYGITDKKVIDEAVKTGSKVEGENVLLRHIASNGSVGGGVDEDSDGDADVEASFNLNNI